MPNNLMCETPKSLDATHQPVVVCVDTSTSMLQDAGNGMTKIKMVENMINSLANLSGLSETEKNAVDICVLQFNDMVGTVVDWKPLSSFKGGVTLEAGGCTALGSAIFAARDKVRERRYAYNNQNVACRRAQIFVYTDGFSTENLDAIYAESQRYFNRTEPAPSAKLNLITIPTYYEGRMISLTNEVCIKEYKEMVNGFGKAVAFIDAQDCINGIPASFKFMADSIVSWSQSAPGDTVKTDLSSDSLRAVNNHGGITKDSNGNRVAIDEDLDII